MLFGDCRMQNHTWNFDIEQLAEKLAITNLINAVFEKNPDLD
jgi:glucokinase